MKNKYISRSKLIISLLFILNVCLKGQTIDSVITIEMNQVVISANKTEKPLFELTVPATIITKEEIKNSGHSRLDEIISEQVGVVTVPGYGGSEGVQIQGIDPDYTLVLIDGMPVIGRVAGVLDLSRISLGNIERVEMIKGASSSLYGSEALGGVINIITNREKKDGFNSRGYYQFGSFKTQDLLADINYNLKNLSVYGNINSYLSDGFDLIDGDGQKTVEAFKNITGSVGAGYNLNYFGKVNLNYKRFSENRDGTIFITSPGTENKSRTSEKNFSLKYKNYLSKKISISLDFYSSSYDNNEEKINLNNITLKNYFKQTINRTDIRLKYKTDKKSYLIFGLGQDNESLKRTNISVIPDHKSKFLYIQHDWKSTQKLNIVTGIRFDKHQNYKNQLSPKVSAKFNFNDSFNLKGSFGYGYKTPDFRQLYLNFVNSSSGYIVLGTRVIDSVIEELESTDQLLFYNEMFNNDLLSERSNSLNLGIQYFINPSLPFEINIFRNNIYNLIESNIVGRKTNGQTIYSYSNLNKVVTQGVEIQGNWYPLKNLSVKGGYQMLYAKDKKALEDFRSELVYARDPISKQSFQLNSRDYFGLYGRSKHQFNIRFSYYINQNKDNFNLRLNYRGKFGLRDTNNNAHLDRFDNFIRGHFITNISYNKTIIKKISIQFLVKNLLNYKDIENLLNNPGRVYSIRISFNS